MSDYTPTTDEVRADYVRDHTRGYDEYQGDQTLTAMQEHYGAEFDSWLAQHDAEVRTAALREAMAEALEEERDQYKAGAQELGAYLIDVTAKIALLREMVHAWDTRAADPGKSPDGLISDIREVLA
jgi:ABC-type Zn2+ transport system substrate-binding protein/surface adhesin